MAKRRAKGSGTIFKNKNGYYVHQYTDATGAKKTKSLRTKNRTEAQKAAEDFEKALKAKDKKEVLFQAAQAKGIIDAKTLPLADIWNEFVSSNPTASDGTLKNYERNLKEFIDWLIAERPSITSFTQIDQETAISYMEYVWTTGISANTYNYKRGSLATITKTLMNKYKIEVNYWISTERKRGVQQKRLPLNREQVNKLLDALEDDSTIPYPVETKCLIRLCLFAGMRLYDAVHIKWENINSDNNIISYEPQKTKLTSGVVATVPILPLLLEALNNLENRSDYILPQIQEHYNRNPDYIKSKLVKIINDVTGEKRNNSKVQKAINRNQYGVHSLRATFATEVAKTGTNSASLARMLGDTIRTIDKYYIGMDLNQQIIEGYNIPNSSNNGREMMKRLADTLPIEDVNEILEKYGKHSLEL